MKRKIGHFFLGVSIFLFFFLLVFKQDFVFASEIAVSTKISLSNPYPKPGEEITVSVNSSNNQTAYVSLYYIPVEKAKDRSQVCSWPGGWQTITHNLPLSNSVGSLKWTVPSTPGGYYIVANLWESNGSVQCVGSYTWDNTQQCGDHLECLNSYVSLVVTKPHQVGPASVIAYKEEFGPGWEVTRLVDGDPSTAWSSKSYNSDPNNVSDGIIFKFNSPQKIAKIIIIPRVYNNQIQAFPPDWSISVSNDNINWKILAGYEFKGYRPPAPTGNEAPRLTFSINTTYQYFGISIHKAGKDQYGNYYAQLAEVEFYDSECDKDSDCQTGEICRNNVCGIETVDYWGLKPGDYWIYDGVDKYGGTDFHFRSRVDIEKKIEDCDREHFVWRVTSGGACPAPHQCYWGNKSLRFFWANPLADNESYIYCPISKRYEQSPNNYQDLGTLYQRDYLEIKSADNQQSTPQLACTIPKFLTGYDGETEYRHTLQYDWFFKTNINDICSRNSDSFSKADEVVRFKKIDINTPAYQGPALLVSMGEKAGWCLREDWYFVKGIGYTQIDQWLCNKSPSDCYPANTSCQCTAWADIEGNHPNCYKNITIDNPAVSLKLAKYYTGQPLIVGLTSNSKIQPTKFLVAKKGEPINIKFLIDGLPYTFEGYTEINQPFVSPDGNTILNPGNGWLKYDKWINETGIITLIANNNLEGGIYKTSLRPFIFEAPADVDNPSANPKVIKENNLPLSQEVKLAITPFSGENLRDLLLSYTTETNYDLTTDGVTNSLDFAEAIQQ